MSFDLTLQEGQLLVNLARETVKTFLEKKQVLAPPKDTPKKLFEKCGVFVTLSVPKKGEKQLRGCIGYPYPTEPLIKAVIDSAIEAATQDPRFLPVTMEELDKIVFEVSVLTPPEKIEVEDPREYVKKIKVGQDGLIVEKYGHKGLLLPQVPVEWCWEEEEFLCQCCNKAGVNLDSWLTEDVKIYKFQAIIFEEEKPNGNIIRLSLQRS
jgi:uncharacterized protein